MLAGDENCWRAGGPDQRHVGDARRRRAGRHTLPVFARWRAIRPGNAGRHADHARRVDRGDALGPRHRSQLGRRLSERGRRRDVRTPGPSNPVTSTCGSTKSWRSTPRPTITTADHPDTIELYNYGLGRRSISGGMTISDNPADTDKYVFPAGTTDSTRANIVALRRGRPNGTSGMHLGFNLDRNGETLTIYSSTAGGGAGRRFDELRHPVADDFSVGVGSDRRLAVEHADARLGQCRPADGRSRCARRSTSGWRSKIDLYQNDRLELLQLRHAAGVAGGVAAHGQPRRQARQARNRGR